LIRGAVAHFGDKLTISKTEQANGSICFDLRQAD